MSSMFNTSSLTSKAANSFTKAASSATSTLTTAVNSAMKAVNSAATSTLSAVNSAATSTLSAVNSAAPAVNSLMPFNNSGKNMGINSDKKSDTNNFRNIFNTFNSEKNTNSGAAAPSSGTSVYGIIFGVLLFLVATFLVAMFVFKDEFEIAWNYLVGSFRKLFKMDTPTNETPEDKDKRAENDVTTPPPSNIDTATKPTSILDSILPMGSKEVFNVSLNDYTYYDAQPLCLALGAELASYEQVKEAWNKGGDWCNYGWTKGQLAIYPTQKDTWDKLQQGPLDEKGACGRPGVNGGYFDNPEMRFGVNCYGVKPDQSANDERLLMENGTIPKTASTLKMDKQIQDIKNNLDMIGILPFNASKWSA